MTETNHEIRFIENMQDALLHIRNLLGGRAVDGTSGAERYPGTLRAKLEVMHPADIAYILEALPIAQRLQVWELVKSERDGEVLIGVSGAVRASLLATMNHEELGAAAGQLDTAEIADLAPDLPQSVLREVFKSLAIAEREQLRSAMSYHKDAVGALMDFNMIAIRDDVSLDVVSRYLRRFGNLPTHTDQVFVVDRDSHLQGVLPMHRIVVNRPEVMVSAIMLTDMVQLHPDDNASLAAQAFERYALVSAPVVDEDGKLVGRVTVNLVLDYVRTESERDLLNHAGLREEDIFASVWKSAQNRWAWLALNLGAAFVASRVIANFAGTIEKFVALATLMPIIAGIAGNTATQTATLIIRSLALRKITQANGARLLFKELGISILNGLVWGGAAGLFAYYWYHDVALGWVMMGAMLLTLMLGALVGLLIPMMLHKLGRNPASGSNVLPTAITASGGFFIFLGLATTFLMH